MIFVFEDNVDNYHQDFADCAKAKAMAKSLTASWDRRDDSSAFGIRLVEGNEHLAKLIDATSNSVNLSTNSKKAWSMSALKAAITGVYKQEVAEALLADRPTTARLSSFFDRCFEEIPILTAISDNMSHKGMIIDKDGPTPAKARKPNPDRGGCVLLRGVGLAVLTQAFAYAVKQDDPAALDEVATRMSELDWYVLKSDAPPQGEDEDAHTYVSHAAQPIWKGMLAMMAADHNFRIKGNEKSAENSFNAICAQLDL